MKIGITSRFMAVVATAAAAVVFIGAPAHADVIDDVQRGTITSLQIRLGGTDLVTGPSVEHTISTPVTGGEFHIGDLTPGELDSLGAAKKCTPGGWDLWAWIDAKNVFGEVLWRFHTDTEYWYDCKVVTAVPFVTVYGSDYSYFWGWDKTIASQKSGVGTKTATVVGAGSFKQCGNFGFGEACMAHDSAKITMHLFADGTFSAVGH